jgi:glutamate-1-semialdehyde aminotransferase
LWDAHATEERGYLEREELESLLRHLHQAHKTLCTSTHINKKTSLSLTFKFEEFEEFEEKGQCWTNQHSTFHVSVLTQGIVLRSVLIQP